MAPLEPARRACRIWFAALALALVSLGAAFHWGVGHPELRQSAATLSFSTAGALTAAVLLPFPYALRAVVGLALGAALLGLGLRELGPAAGLDVDGVARGLARVVALCTLPAALLFRAHYRAYPRARLVLAVALCAALPFVALEARLLFDSGAAPLARVAAAACAIAISCSLLGFMGAATTGAGSFAASLVVLSLSGELAIRELTGASEPGLLPAGAAAVACACAAVLASIGGFQLLAAALAHDARRLAKKPPLFSDPELERPNTLS